jgi:hypothetical protein
LNFNITLTPHLKGCDEILKSKDRGFEKIARKTRTQRKKEAQEKIEEGLNEVKLSKIEKEDKLSADDIRNGPIRSLSIRVSKNELKKNKAELRDRFKKMLQNRKEKQDG